ncbi:GNAT family N-acetyltransferase [Micromonospora sp. FIMYZ51]|uniref:GNAT family N-acetyltransferase n=1 Tax=Micromonospora sp. FIMYZ51 TaxID=3051832 RepID=UPI0031202DA6
MSADSETAPCISATDADGHRLRMRAWQGDHVTTRLLIRPARRSDLDGVGPLAGSLSRAQVRLQAAERGDESMAVAVLASWIVGVQSIRWSRGCDPPHPWLYGLHVTPEVQRQGIGRALVQAAEDLGRRRGAHRMTLDVDVDDAGAIAFYQALGYVVRRPHQHRWRSVDPQTGDVIAEGTAATLIMGRALR